MKRIIFVDDDADLLDSTRALLHKRRSQWQMVFLHSAMEAIAELEQQPADLIVTDVRMPGMDGRELLSIVKSRWPNTIRIVLSGYPEQMQLLKLVSLAHQYLSTPCNAPQLENSIERCFHLHTILQQESLRAVVGRISSLPTMPKIYAQLQTVMAQPNASGTEITDIISHDVAIATKVLQVANSAFFRSAKPITQIKNAVSHLGFASIRNLVMSAEIFSNWQHTASSSGLNADQLQSHALATASACMSLAAKTPLADDAWLVGLVHDIGYWILMQECPAQLAQAMELARTQGIPSYQAEQQVIGASHAEIGAYLLGLWGLPYSVVEAVALHHTPQAVEQHGFDLLAIVAVAHSLLDQQDPQALQISSEMEPIVDADYFATLNPPFDWQEATRRVHTTYSNPMS